MAVKRISKINNSWPELFNFQNSFNCPWLGLLRTALLPVHKVIINAIFQDGMNGICLYFVNKHRLDGRYWDSAFCSLLFLCLCNVRFPHYFQMFVESIWSLIFIRPSNVITRGGRRPPFFVRSISPRLC